jgi:formate-nitrite transporter family protein
VDDEAGEDSPHLDESEQRQAAERRAVGPLVIHEIVREQGEAELKRSVSGLAWSGLASGLSIGFSFIGQATLQASLPATPAMRLVSAFGYTLGFLIVVLGRQQLFTETTLTAAIPLLTRRNLPTLGATMRVWAVVLLANLAATWALAAAAGPTVFQPATVTAMAELARHTVAHDFGHTLVNAGYAGWLIGLMVWLLPASGSARPFIIILLTYAIAACQFPHVIAGSVEAAWGVLHAGTPFADYWSRFLAPTLLGNVIGGTLLAALLNHAPIADELKGVRD